MGRSIGVPKELPCPGQGLSTVGLMLHVTWEFVCGTKEPCLPEFLKAPLSRYSPQPFWVCFYSFTWFLPYCTRDLYLAFLHHPPDQTGPFVKLS